MAGVVRQGRVPHLHDRGVPGQASREQSGGRLRPLDAQRERPQPAQREPDLARAGDRAVLRAVAVQRRPELRVVGHGRAEHDVRVSGEILRHRVHDDVRAPGERVLPEGGREGVVDGGEPAAVAGGRDQGGDVRDLEHRVGRGLEPQQPAPRAGGVVECGDDRVRVLDVDPDDADPVPALQLVRETQRRLVGVLRDDDRAVVGHLGEHGRDRGESRPEDERRKGGALERSERLLER